MYQYLTGKIFSWTGTDRHQYSSMACMGHGEYELLDWEFSVKKEAGTPHTWQRLKSCRVP